jgi:hypothetical protein
MIECMSLWLGLKMSACLYCAWMCDYGRWSRGGVEILGSKIYRYVLKKNLDKN